MDLQAVAVLDRLRLIVDDLAHKFLESVREEWLVERADLVEQASKHPDVRLEVIA